MNKLIALVLSMGMVFFCSFDEIHAMKKSEKGGGNNRRGSGRQSQSDKKKVVENNSNQSPLPQISSNNSNVDVVEELASSVEKLELESDKDPAVQQSRQQDFVDVSLVDEGDKKDDDSVVIGAEVVTDPSGGDSVIVQEHHEFQDPIVMVEKSASQDLQSQSMQILNSGSDQGSLDGVDEPVQLKESEQQLLDDGSIEGKEEKQEIVLEDDLVNSVVDQAAQVQDSKLFQVTFRDNQEKEVFTHCDSYRFCEFMIHALKRMSEPETVSMVRHYGFGLGHVPLLLVWSSHLFDRLEQSRTYCMETQDLKDILMLLLIVDLRAQVDAACIEHMKKSSPSRNALAVQTDSKAIEQATSSALFTAGYLKRKLVTLWSGKIQEMYRKKKLPCYSTILQKVKDIASQWQDDQLQSPIWVCCVMHKSYMIFNNLLAGWPAEKFGNWWNPESSLIIACQGCDYSEIRKPKTDEVLAELEKYASWPEYFGDIYALAKVDNAEYDSDGGF